MAGFKLQVFVIFFEKDKMTVRVPIAKAASSGLRNVVNRPSSRRCRSLPDVPGPSGMWARRGQEYEAKINSGDLMLLAEVLRDLYCSPEQTEPSYSERQLYEGLRHSLAKSPWFMAYKLRRRRSSARAWPSRRTR